MYSTLQACDGTTTMQGRQDRTAAMLIAHGFGAHAPLQGGSPLPQVGTKKFEGGSQPQTRNGHPRYYTYARIGQCTLIM